jgi:Fe-S-cluster containining protein
MESNNSILLSEEIRNRVKTQTEFLAQQGLTEDGFQEEVRKKMTEKGLSFVLAVYEVFNGFFDKELRLSGVTLACKKGCSTCCHTLITSTEMEMKEVIYFINALPRTVRMPLIKKAIGLAREWRDYYNENEFAIKIDFFKPFRDWQDKPCPFLNEEEGSCSIYPVRIVDCRTLTSLTPCASLKTKTLFFADLHAEGAVRYRFRCETWATNLIIEEQQRKMGLPNPVSSPVTPVLHWLYMKRKEVG